jgi:hypothetical protein
MLLRTATRLITLAATTTAVLAIASATAAQTRITCESDGGYKYCEVPTRGKGIMVKEISSGVCVASVNWSYDRRGIWVDQGCKGEFEVNDKWPGGKPGGADRPTPDPGVTVPSWAVGTFKGTIADWNNEEFTVTIETNGIATLVRADGTFYGKWMDGLIHVPAPGSINYEVKKKNDGIEVSSLTNRTHRVMQLSRVK